METLDYASPAAFQPKRLLGCVSTTFNGIGLLCGFISGASSDLEVRVDIMVCMSIAFGIAFIASTLAMVHRRSRTSAATLSFVFGLFAWVFLVPALFSDH
jgi:hypothetical protein